MALIILEECINCGVCEAECPNIAISEGEVIYDIDPSRCTECVGHFDKPQCQIICPVDCIVLDPGYQETKETLMVKYHKIIASS